MTATPSAARLIVRLVPSPAAAVVGSSLEAVDSFVPFPSAVDDHQSGNARFLTDRGAGWLLPQAELTPERLAQILLQATRPGLLACALQARQMEKTGATEELVAACEELARSRATP